MKFKIGDRVRCISPGNIGAGWKKDFEFVVTSVLDSRNSDYVCYFGGFGGNGCYGSELELVENKPKQTIMKNIIEKARLAIKAEPEKSLIAKGITDINDVLTPEGKDLFDDFLYRTNKAAFVADPAVAALLAEQEK